MQFSKGLKRYRRLLALLDDLTFEDVTYHIGIDPDGTNATVITNIKTKESALININGDDINVACFNAHYQSKAVMHITEDHHVVGVTQQILNLI